MWYVWFAVALLGHLSVSLFCAWCFRSYTAFCTVPKPEAFGQARFLVEATRAQGYSFKPSDFMVFYTTTTERWASRRWVGIYFLAGLVVLAGILAIHLIRPGLI
jgi:hypothetical protein